MCPKNNKSLVRYSYSKKFQKLTAPKRLVPTMFNEILQLTCPVQMPPCAPKSQFVIL